MYPPNKREQPDPYQRSNPDGRSDDRQPGPYQQPGPGTYDDRHRQPAPAGQHRRMPAGYPPPGYGYAPAAPPPRKKRRIFMWFFFAVQALLLIWLITALATGNHSNTTDLAQACNGHNWFPLFKSHADCMTHYNNALNDAQDVGKGIGVALIVVIWVVVDFFLGLGYGIYRLATRSR
ncbi:MAG: hypothetical protein ACRDOK_30025 [Streptosporangiaceae bacterium]